MKCQLAFLLARAQIPKEWVFEEGEDEDEIHEKLSECLNNAMLSKQFKEFGEELGVLEPKSLEDVYKSHLENTSTYIFILIYLFMYLHCDVRSGGGECRFSAREFGGDIRECLRKRRVWERQVNGECRRGKQLGI